MIEFKELNPRAAITRLGVHHHHRSLLLLLHDDLGREEREMTISTRYKPVLLSVVCTHKKTLQNYGLHTQRSSPKAIAGRKLVISTQRGLLMEKAKEKNALYSENLL